MPAWKESGAWVAQLIANAAAPRLVADFERVVKAARKHQAPRMERTEYEVFVDHELGGAFEDLLGDTKPWPSVSISDVVNYYLRDRAFMAELVARAIAEARAK